MPDYLDAALRDLATEIDFPATPDLRAAVAVDLGRLPEKPMAAMDIRPVAPARRHRGRSACRRRGASRTRAAHHDGAHPADGIGAGRSAGHPAGARRARAAGDGRGRRACPRWASRTRCTRAEPVKSSRWCTRLATDLPEMGGHRHRAAGPADPRLARSRARREAGRRVRRHGHPRRGRRRGRLLDRRPAAPRPLLRAGWRGAFGDDAADRRHAGLAAGRRAVSDRVRPRARRDPTHRGVDRRRREPAPRERGSSCTGAIDPQEVRTCDISHGSAWQRWRSAPSPR